MVIDYKQLGGTVNIGLNSAGILKTKGVFEVLGLNSKFVYTGGSLIIVHSNGSQLIPSLNITAGTSTITQDIQLGSIATVDAGFQRSFGLNSTITLGGLILNNQE